MYAFQAYNSLYRNSVYEHPSTPPQFTLYTPTHLCCLNKSQTPENNNLVGILQGKCSNLVRKLPFTLTIDCLYVNIIVSELTQNQYPCQMLFLITKFNHIRYTSLPQTNPLCTESPSYCVNYSNEFIKPNVFTFSAFHSSILFIFLA